MPVGWAFSEGKGNGNYNGKGKGKGKGNGNGKGNGKLDQFSVLSFQFSVRQLQLQLQLQPQLQPQKRNTEILSGAQKDFFLFLFGGGQATARRGSRVVRRFRFTLTILETPGSCMVTP